MYARTLRSVVVEQSVATDLADVTVPVLDVAAVLDEGAPVGSTSGFYSSLEVVTWRPHPSERVHADGKAILKFSTSTP